MNMSKAYGQAEVTWREQDVQEPDHEKKPGILEEVLEHTEKASSINGIVIGTLEQVDEQHIPHVDFPMNPTGKPVSARSTVELKTVHVGRNVALMFEQNNVRKPIVIGLMHVPEKRPVEVVTDRKIHEIIAEKELLLRCGESSILLREDGKIIIKGLDILSRARRTNKVKGGSIQLN